MHPHHVHISYASPRVTYRGAFSEEKKQDVREKNADQQRTARAGYSEEKKQDVLEKDAKDVLLLERAVDRSAEEHELARRADDARPQPPTLEETSRRHPRRALAAANRNAIDLRISIEARPICVQEKRHLPREPIFSQSPVPP